MAINREAQVLIRFKLAGLNTTRRTMEREFGRLSGRTSYYAGMIQSRLGYMAIAGAAAIAVGIGKSIKSFAEFDQAIMNSVSVMKDGRENMQALRDQAMSLGREIPYSAIQIAKAYYYMGSAGWSAVASMKAMKTAGMLAAATQSQLEGTTRYLMQTLNQFGKSADDAYHFANVFMAGIKNSQLQMQTLGQALENVGPVAAAVGMSLEDVVSALMILHNAGVRGQKAGRHLRIMFSRLIRPIGRSKDRLEALGGTLEDVTVTEKEFADSMDFLTAAGIDAAGMFDMFRQRAGGSAMAVAANTDEMRLFIELLKSKTALIETFNIQMEGMKMRFMMLNVAVTNIGTKLGTAFEVPLKIITWLLTKFTQVIAARGPLFFGIVAFTSVIMMASLAINGFAWVFKGMLMQAQMTFGMFKFLILSTLGIQKGFRGMGKAAIQAHMAMSLVAKGIRKNLSAAYMTVTSNKNLARTNKLLGESNGKLSGTFVRLATSIWGSILPLAAIVGVILLVITAFGTYLRHQEKINSTLKLWLVTSRDMWQEWGRNIGETLKNVWNTHFAKFFNLIREGFQKFWDWIPDEFFLKKWVKNFESAGKEIKQWVDENIPEIKSKIEEIYKAALGAGKTVADGIKYFVQAVVEDFKLGWDTIIEMVMKLFGVTREEAEKAAVAVKSTMAKVAKATKSMFDQVMSKMKALVMETHGEWKGVANEMDVYKENLRETWKTAIMGLIDGSKTWGDVWEDICNRALENFIDGFLTQMMTSWGSGLAKMAFDFDSWSTMLGAMGAGGGLFGGGAGGAGGGWMQGISGMVGGVASWFGGLFGAAKGGIVQRPTALMAGEAGAEAIIPLNRLEEFTGPKTQEITIVNVVDPSFVGAAIAKDPRVVINVINRDMIEAGSTRRTLRKAI